MKILLTLCCLVAAATASPFLDNLLQGSHQEDNTVLQPDQPDRLRQQTSLDDNQHQAAIDETRSGNQNPPKFGTSFTNGKPVPAFGALINSDGYVPAPVNPATDGRSRINRQPQVKSSSGKKEMINAPVTGSEKQFAGNQQPQRNSYDFSAPSGQSASAFGSSATQFSGSNPSSSGSPGSNPSSSGSPFSQASSPNFSSQPSNFGGSSDNFAGSPSNLGGSAQNFDGSAQNFGGSTQNFGGSAQNFDGSAQKFAGPAQNFAGSAQNFNGSPQNFAESAQNFGSQPSNISPVPMSNPMLFSPDISQSPSSVPYNVQIDDESDLYLRTALPFPGFRPTKYTSLDLSQVNLQSARNSGFQEYLTVADDDWSGEGEVYRLIGVAPSSAVQGGAATTYAANIGSTVPIYLELDDYNEGSKITRYLASRPQGGAAQRPFSIRAETTLAGNSFAVLLDD